ncbi:MAG: cytochrome c [Rhodothermales bacterium]
MNKATTLILFAAFVLASCRGTLSDREPIHLNRNMDFQERFDPQESNPFFADNRSMRMPVAGTVARGMLREDVGFYEGRGTDGGYVEDLPVPTTMALLERGQERYEIFCTPCHGSAGDGQGIVATGGYGLTPVPTFHGERLREVEDGYVYDVIANGVRTMPAYGKQVPTADRWAIVAYVRALQRSQYATPDDVPAGIRAEIQQGAGSSGRE